MRSVEELLKTQGVEFLVNTTERESYEMFFVHKKLETVRATCTTERTVTVYREHDGKKGNYTFKVFASDTEESILKKIELAKEQCLLIDNENFALPAAETFDREIPSSLTSLPPREMGEKIANACFAADRYENGSINALEVFLYRDHITVKNSNGLHKTEHKCRAMVEAIPTWNENGDSVELYEAYHFTEWDEAAIIAEIDGKMKEVRDRYHAKKPQTEITAPVLLRAAELNELFDAISDDLNYAAVYNRSNCYQKGQNLLSGDGDQITLTRKGEIKGSRFSALFDQDGVTLKDTPVIEKGVVTSYHGANRFAQYLKEEVTGSLPCIEVEAGTLTEEEIEGAPYFECVSLSGLQGDLYSDYIGGEIRLAYYFDGEKKIPVTGVSISGKLSEALASIRLSQKRKLSGSYFGPEKAMLKGLKIF